MQGSVPVFVVEDDPLYLEMIVDFIKARYKRIVVHTFTDGESALAALHLKPVIVILDYILNAKNPDAVNGLDVLQALSRKCPKARTIILSAQDDIAVSVNTMKYGAYDYVIKNESDVYRIQNILNHIFTLIDYDQRIARTRAAMVVIGIAMLAVGLIIVFG